MKIGLSFPKYGSDNIHNLTYEYALLKRRFKFPNCKHYQIGYFHLNILAG